MFKSIPAAIGLPKQMPIRVICTQCCLTSVIKFKFKSIHHGTASGCTSVRVADNHFVKNWLQRIKNGCLKDSDENILERPDCKKGFVSDSDLSTSKSDRQVCNFRGFQSPRIRQIKFRRGLIEVVQQRFRVNENIETNAEIAKCDPFGTTLHT